MAFIVEMVSVHELRSQKLAATFSCHVDIWGALHDAGRAYGWRPQGAVEIDSQGNRLPSTTHDLAYRPDEWAYPKRVLQGDAAAWADALEKAKFHLTSASAVQPSPALIRDDMTDTELRSANAGLSPQFVQEFIDFLRVGAFDFAYDD